MRRQPDFPMVLLILLILIMIPLFAVAVRGPTVVTEGMRIDQMVGIKGAPDALSRYWSKDTERVLYTVWIWEGITVHSAGGRVVEVTEYNTGNLDQWNN